MQPPSPLGMYALATCMHSTAPDGSVRMSRGTPSKLKLDEAGFPSPMGKVRRGDTMITHDPSLLNAFRRAGR